MVVEHVISESRLPRCEFYLFHLFGYMTLGKLLKFRVYVFVKWRKDYC